MGMVNFLSMFCPELQKLLKPIYDLTRRGRPFVWGREQQDAFEEIKCRLIKPPVLQMPNTTGTFNLYSDTKFATGSGLYQIQNGKTQANHVCQQKTTRSCKKLFHYRIRIV